MFRSALYALTLSTAIGAVGCTDRSVSEVNPTRGRVEQKSLPAVPSRQLDILFVVDNSGSMAQEQASLRANFGRFMDVLSTLDGGMPDVHIGVVTSNLGQSAADGVGSASLGTSCALSGDNGAMRTVSPSGARYIVDEAGADGIRHKNYDGTLADAFSAIADVGTLGCGIEQHLGAAKRALASDLNKGFLRDSAKLAVIVIGDEDDCSLESKAFFNNVTDPSVLNFACTQQGIECDGDQDLSVPGARTNCRPRTDSPNLADVDEIAAFIQGLKANPDEDVIVAGIVGDPGNVAIGTDSSNRPVLEPSCTYSGQSAYPAVRTAHFLDQFPQSIQESICGADLSSAMVQIGALLKRSFGDACFDATVADLDPAPGLQADCTVSDYRELADGSQVETGVIPACGTGQTPCWRIEQDAEKCNYTETQLKLVIDRGDAVPDTGELVKVSCVTEERTPAP